MPFGATDDQRLALLIDTQANLEGVKAVWDPAKAARETTPTRERVCLNGLWRWQPADTPPTWRPSPPSLRPPAATRS